MANPFDVYDAPVTKPTAKTERARNPFDDYDPSFDLGLTVRGVLDTGRTLLEAARLSGPQALSDLFRPDLLVDAGDSVPTGAVAGVQMSARGAERVSDYAARKIVAPTVDPLLKLAGQKPLDTSKFGPTRALSGVANNLGGVVKDMRTKEDDGGVSVADMVGEGVGQVGVQIPLTAVAPEVSLPLLFSQGVGAQYQQAEQAGFPVAEIYKLAPEDMTPEIRALRDKMDTALLVSGAITGTSEKFGLDNLVKGSRAFTGSNALNRILSIGLGAAGEGLQEGTEAVGQNAAAKVTYNPNQDIFDGTIGTQAGVGATVGGLATGLIDTFLPGRVRARPNLSILGEVRTPPVAALPGPVAPAPDFAADYEPGPFTGEPVAAAANPFDAYDRPAGETPAPTAPPDETAPRASAPETPTAAPATAAPAAAPETPTAAPAAAPAVYSAPIAPQVQKPEEGKDQGAEPSAPEGTPAPPAPAVSAAGEPAGSVEPAPAAPAAPAQEAPEAKTPIWKQSRREYVDAAGKAARSPYRMGGGFGAEQDAREKAAKEHEAAVDEAVLRGEDVPDDALYPKHMDEARFMSAARRDAERNGKPFNEEFARQEWNYFSGDPAYQNARAEWLARAAVSSEPAAPTELETAPVRSAAPPETAAPSLDDDLEVLTPEDGQELTQAIIDEAARRRWTGKSSPKRDEFYSGARVGRGASKWGKTVPTETHKAGEQFAREWIAKRAAERRGATARAVKPGDTADYEAAPRMDVAESDAEEAAPLVGVVSGRVPREKAVKADTPAFRQFFQQSKVVDEAGEAKVVYHGTNAEDFDAFKPFSWFAGSADLANQFLGGRRGKPTTGPRRRIVPAYLSIQNPADFSSLDVHVALTPRQFAAHVGADFDQLDAAARRLGVEAHQEFARKMPGMEVSMGEFGTSSAHRPGFAPRPDEARPLWMYLDMPQLMRALEELGFDGVKARETIKGTTSETWMAFRPDQIKSVFNAGNFDQSDDRMLADTAALSDERRRGGSMSPTFIDYATTTGRSRFNQAFRDAGYDPDEAVNFAPEKQIQILSKQLSDTFGFRAVSDKGTQARVGGQANARAAIDAMLDAYRTFQWMTSALGLPNKALGLGGELALNFSGDRRTSYFGAYYPGAKSIDLVVTGRQRANSFAHEWAHALDYHLIEKLIANPQASMNLSGETRAVGLDKMRPSIEGAFVEVMNALFFDKAKLAAEVLKLQALIDKGGAGAKTAQKQLDAIYAGESRNRTAASDYANKARRFGDPGYWAKPTEMLARAFEAYVGFKVGAAGGETAVLSKPDEAYLDNADKRLRETFPKDSERAEIFRAFDQLIAMLQVNQTFGGDPLAAPPGDYDVTDPYHFIKAAGGNADAIQQAREEFRALRNGIDRLSKDPKGWAQDFLGEAGKRVGLSGRPPNPRMSVSARAIAHALELVAPQDMWLHHLARRNKGRGREYLDALADLVAHRPGTGKAVDETYEEEYGRRWRQGANAIGAALKVNGFKGESLPAESLARIRAVLLGKGSAANATPQEKSVARALREQMDRAYLDGQQVGLDQGYVRDTGYVPRIVEETAVYDDPKGFEAQATKVYELVFDRAMDQAGEKRLSELQKRWRQVRLKNPTAITAADEAEYVRIRDGIRAANRAIRKAERDMKAGAISPAAGQAIIDAAVQKIEDLTDALQDLVRPLWTATAARDWTEAIIAGGPMDFAVKGPTGDFLKSRVLPPEADDLMADYYVNDPIEAALIYLRGMARRTAYVRRFGLPMGEGVNSDLDSVVDRSETIKTAIAANPKKYDLSTPRGRVAVVNDLTDTAKTSRIEMLLTEAARAGANPEDVKTFRGAIERLTGMGDSVEFSGLRSAGSKTFALGTIMLMARSAWTGFTEPLAISLRSGSLKASFDTMVAYLKELNQSDASVRERAVLANAMGLITDPYTEGMIQASMDMTYGDSVQTQKLVARYHDRISMLSPMTNAHRRATLAGTWTVLREWAAKIANPKDTAFGRAEFNAEQARAEFRELGVPAEHVDSFANWILSFDKGLPSPNDLDTAPGRAFMVAARRFNHQTVQETMRVNKPVYASGTWGRLVYALLGFNYTFMRNVHLRMIRKTTRDARARQETGSNPFSAWAASAGTTAGIAAAGFATMFLGQFLQTMFREWMFNRDNWDKNEKEGKLREWLFNLSLSRLGILGPADTLWQAATGLRYERDLTSLFTGSYVGYIMNQGLQPVLNVMFGRNADSTDTAERKAVKAIYQMTAAPLIATAAVAVPAGAVVGRTLGVGGQIATSNQTANKVADWVLGPKEAEDGFEDPDLPKDPEFKE